MHERGLHDVEEDGFDRVDGERLTEDLVRALEVQHPQRLSQFPRELAGRASTRGSHGLFLHDGGRARWRYPLRDQVAHLADHGQVLLAVVAVATGRALRVGETVTALPLAQRTGRYPRALLDLGDGVLSGCLPHGFCQTLDILTVGPVRVIVKYCDAATILSLTQCTMLV